MGTLLELFPDGVFEKNFVPCLRYYEMLSIALTCKFAHAKMRPHLENYIRDYEHARDALIVWRMLSISDSYGRYFEMRKGIWMLTIFPGITRVFSVRLKVCKVTEKFRERAEVTSKLLRTFLRGNNTGVERKFVPCDKATSPHLVYSTEMNMIDAIRLLVDDGAIHNSNVRIIEFEKHPELIFWCGLPDALSSDILGDAQWAFASKRYTFDYFRSRIDDLHEDVDIETAEETLLDGLHPSRWLDSPYYDTIYPWALRVYDVVTNRFERVKTRRIEEKAKKAEEKRKRDEEWREKEEEYKKNSVQGELELEMEIVRALGTKRKWESPKIDHYFTKKTRRDADSL